ncbi:hypothetical protein [Nocardia blacklockiae]|uniref:hypothetical protein n=1 Tax=Nocardia blacklockiae TaxID=480036 RepID=UPI0018941557|nr:hypothetical protein [Nocardia blacklockiae]MBF6171415.1 hypothetical protein [Nocardia blacklockiae]
MREDRPSEDELRRNFERELESVRTGGGLTSESGLDTETEEALWAIADAHPDIDDELVAAARRAFAAQLDGSHAAARQAALARKLERFGRRG